MLPELSNASVPFEIRVGCEDRPKQPRVGSPHSEVSSWAYCVIRPSSDAEGVDRHSVMVTQDVRFRANVGESHFLNP